MIYVMCSVLVYIVINVMQLLCEVCCTVACVMFNFMWLIEKICHVDCCGLPLVMVKPRQQVTV